MRIRILIFILLATSLNGYCQGWTEQNVGVKTTVRSNGGFTADTSLLVPVRDSVKPVWWNDAKRTYNGQIQLLPTGTMVYYYNGWRVFGSGGGGAGTVTSITSVAPLLSTPNPITSAGTIRVDTGRGLFQVTTGYDLNKVRDSLQVNINGKMSYADTASLSNRINAKQNFTDTTTYDATKTNLRDTASALRTAIATKLNISDTAAMLAGYVNSASNGLTKTGKNVTLGGSLTAATTITTTGVNTIALAGLQSGAVGDSVLVANPTTGVIARRAFPSAGAASWSLTGNSGTNPTTNYIGTSDVQNLSVRANAIQRMQVRQDGRINIASKIGTLADSSFIIERNAGVVAEFNIFNGIRLGASATLTASGLCFGEGAQQLGFQGVVIGNSSYNDASQGLVLGNANINQGVRSVLVGRGNTCTQDDNVLVGMMLRSTHLGNNLGTDGTNAGNYLSRKPYEWNHHHTTGFYFSTGLIATPVYVNIDSQASVDAALYKSHGATPIATAGTGAGSSPTITVTGTPNNYTLTITVGGTPTGGGVIATITGFPTSSVAMAPVWSGNTTLEALSGSQRPGVTGTTTSHVITSGAVPLSSAVTYIFNIISIPKL